jgi:glutamine synthetase
VQRALGFGNEKDHPEVAPSQFEMNYGYTEAPSRRPGAALQADRRQVAAQMDLTACFLPKPVAGVNGSGCTPTCRSRRGQEPLLRPRRARTGLSPSPGVFINRILASADDICLILNSSVNAYRRLDPHFEAPNQIKVSASDRGAMVRIPIGNERTARIEVRSIAPDANPYLAIYALLQDRPRGAGGGGGRDGKRSRARASCPTTSTTRSACSRRASMPGAARRGCTRSTPSSSSPQAERCAKALGSRVKRSEIQFHHEVTNQYLWGQF